MCPSLIQIGSKTAEKNSAQTNRQTDTTKIMVTWPWTKRIRPRYQNCSVLYFVYDSCAQWYTWHDGTTVGFSWGFSCFFCIFELLPGCVRANILHFVGPIANLKGPYFQQSLSVCLCVSDRHFYPSTLTDFNETWSQGPYSDLVWPPP